jgi:hypothetical protein
MVRGTIYLEAGAVIAGNLKTINSGYRDFVGVKNYNDIDLWSAGHSAWAVGPDMSINIIHPDPNVNPAIVSWMKQNNVKLATTAVSNQDFDFIVIRENRGDYSTLYYIGGR